MELKPELAQSIVDHMMTQIPYNINIMNKKGYIIASGNKDRINTLHLGAVDAIKQKKTLPMDQHHGDHGQPGINMPLKFENEIIGVIGITGDPAKVTPLASLLKMSVELLLQQRQRNEQEHKIDKARQRFIYQWINISRQQKPETDKELVTEAQRLNISLEAKRLVIAVIKESEDRPKIINNSEIITFSLSNRIELIIIKSEYQANLICQKLERQHTEYGVSEWDNMVGKLADQAIATLHLRNIFGDQPLRHYSQIAFIERILESNLQPLPLINQFTNLAKRKDGQELIDTIRKFINHNMNVNQTAQSLFVHRNTLNNRLMRIKEIFNLDPKNTADLFQLFVGYIFFYSQQLS